MNISIKLILGFLLVALTASFTTLSALRSYKNIDDEFERLMHEPVPNIKALEALKNNGMQIVSSTMEIGFILSESEGESKLLEDEQDQLSSYGHGEYKKSLKIYEEAVNKSDKKQLDCYDRVKKTGDTLIKTSLAIILMKERGIRGEEVLNKKEEFEEQEKAFLQAIDAALVYQYTILETEKSNVNMTIENSSRTTILITLLTFALALIFGLFISRNISNRITKLKQASAAIGSGELENYIGIKSKDEIGELASSFNRMIDNLRESRTDLLSAKIFTDNIVNSIPDILFVTTMDMEIIRVNDATVKFTGYSEKELVGQNARLFYVVQFSDVEFEKFKSIGFINGFENAYRTKDGLEIPVSVSASIMYNAKGDPSGIVTIAQDITERKAAEEQLKIYNQKLQQSNRELQDFAYVASHDLQEPLRKVQAFANRLQTKYEDKLEGSGLDYLERMKNAAERMQTLIKDLLIFSRVTTKAQPFVPVDLKTVAEEVLSDLEIGIEESNARIEIGDLPVIEADPLQMRQLMQNLIGNAIKFSGKQQYPLIQLSSQLVSSSSNGQGAGGKSYRIEIKDNGIGFEEKYLDRIFTVFQRLHGRTEYEGSGVGLAVCRKIVERHHGSITAQSRPNEGASFIITLPVKQKENHNA